LELFAGKLAVLPLFRGLSPLQLAAVTRRAERVNYTPGSFIIEQNATADGAVLVVEGSAMRVSGPGVEPPGESVGVGSLIGEAAMLIETTFGSTIVARSIVRTVHLRRDTLLAQMMDDPALADTLMNNLAARLRSVADELRRVEELLGCPSVPREELPMMMARSA
jgi:CRP-like cAMP-binding protein